MPSTAFWIVAKAAVRPSGKFFQVKKQVRLFSFFWQKKPERNTQPTGRRLFWGSDQNIIKSTYPEVKTPRLPLHEFLLENVGQWEDKIALVRKVKLNLGGHLCLLGTTKECAETGKKLTYKEVVKLSRALAASFQKKFNLKKGDHVAVILPNCPEYPIVLIAGSMTGAISMTINPTYTHVEIAMQLKDVHPKLVVTISEMYKKCFDTLKETKMEVPIVVVKNYPDSDMPAGAVSFSELVENFSPGDWNPVDFEPSDDAVLPYSSGTSGFPKGVQLSHSNLVTNLTQYEMVSELKSNPDKETNQSLILGLLPMFHIYGMVVVAFDGLRHGGRVIVLPRFEPKLFIDTIYAKKVQLLFVAPPLVFFMGNSSLVEPKHLKYAQYVVVGAAPCGEKDVQKLRKKGEHLEIPQGYGMTESSPIVAISHKDRFHKISSVGYPLPSTWIKVVDVGSEKVLSSGKRGEIWVKGPQVMKGYYNQPEETKNTLTSDGWLKTGDIGYYDEEGDLYVVDRKKELIKVKGFQVAPAELEEFIRSNPKVLDVGVIGVPHPQYGEVPKAFVVLKEGVSSTEEEIQEFVSERLSSYKHLRGGVEFVKEIPRSNAGKILRKELRVLNTVKFF